MGKAIDIYTDMGRFTIAAKHHQTIAELYESDIADLERAMQHYEKSADYFRVSTFSRFEIEIIFLDFNNSNDNKTFLCIHLVPFQILFVFE